MYIVVSKKENVQTDEKGEFLYDEEGVPALHDEEDVGILVKTHPLQAIVEGVMGFILRAEVYWNLRRNPSPAWEDPNELVWLSADSNDGADETDEDDQSDNDEGQDVSEFESDDAQNFTPQ